MPCNGSFLFSRAFHVIYVHMGDIQWHSSTQFIALVPPNKTEFSEDMSASKSMYKRLIQKP